MPKAIYKGDRDVDPCFKEDPCSPEDLDNFTYDKTWKPKTSITPPGRLPYSMTSVILSGTPA